MLNALPSNPEDIPIINFSNITIELGHRLLVQVARMFIVIICLLTPERFVFAQQIMNIGDSGYQAVGLFCFKWMSNGVTEIHLVKITGEKNETLFSKVMTNAVNAPICFTNAVVAVSTDGVINKYNLKGELVFSAAPPEFKGVAWGAGRLTDRYIFVSQLTGHSFEETNWVFHLWVIDISGKKPVMESKSEIIRPWQILSTRGQIVVVGEKDVQRLPSPEK